MYDFDIIISCAEQPRPNTAFVAYILAKDHDTLVRWGRKLGVGGRLIQFTKVGRVPYIEVGYLTHKRIRAQWQKIPELTMLQVSQYMQKHYKLLTI